MMKELLKSICSNIFLRLMLLLLLMTGLVSLSFHTSFRSPAFNGKRVTIDTEQNRFTKVVLAQKLEEPMQFEILKDGRVLFAERKGKLKLYSPATGKVKVIAQIPVSTKYTSKTGVVTEGEDGLQGVILDPDFDTNNWIYLYYSKEGKEEKNILVRYEWRNEVLVESSRKLVLEVDVQREECCHVGGGMLFDAQGNLLLTTGDNTFSRSSSGFTPIDERPGQAPRDAQKSSGNTNDLRGKILRIHPEPDGSYTIPEGNLFPKGTPKTRPEIYTMGNRNPWRMTIDSKTGWLYWGEVGPDGTNDTVGRGPKAYDEFNRAKRAGNFGWPYFVADDKAYWDYDFETKQSGALFDKNRPVNHSPNNSGLVDLPPSEPSLVWYPYIVSDEFPVLGSGSRSATGGPIFRQADFKNPKRPFPSYYEGKWFVTDWARGWLVAIAMDDDGNYKSMERFLPNEILRGPIDMDFGPDGDLYILEYGNGYFSDNPEAQLVKIEYNAGNRKPVVEASANKRGGALPFKLQLSSAGTRDFDNDVLSYEWKLTAKNRPTRVFKEADPLVNITQAGIYTATLTVTDAKGAKNSKAVQVTAGNEPPVVYFDFNGSNKSFFTPGKTINYTVKVSDKEDGSLDDKKITPSRVAVSIDYLTEGYDLTVIASKQRSADNSIQFAGGKNLIDKSDCKACHNLNTKSLGPSFTQVAEKYRANAAAMARLANKIINGGSGVWGDAAMPAHPSISTNDATAMVKYILSVGEKRDVQSRPVTGTYTTQVPAGENDRGSFVWRAAYTDKGTSLASAQSAEEMLILRNSTVRVANLDGFDNVEFNPGRSRATVMGPVSFLSMKRIDLTGIRDIEFAATAYGMSSGKGGVIEIRLDSPSGPLAGKTENIAAAVQGAARSGGRQGRTRAEITETKGMRDVFFVFVNSNAAKGDVLFHLTDIKFNMKD